MIASIFALLFYFLSTYLLWIFYLAVMNLKRAKEAGKLNKFAAMLGAPVLFVGYVLDFIVNVLVMTVLLVEIPKELTVTSRLSRHIRESSGFRLAVASWFIPILDPFDPSGRHIT